MFTSARWRLTLWFVAALALILAVIGVAVFFTARAVLFDAVDDGLRSRAMDEVRLLLPRLPPHVRAQQTLRDVIVGPAFTAGGYFYALMDSDGELVAGTPNVDPEGLASQETIEKALRGDPAFENTDSSTGESLRVYVVPVEGPLGAKLVLEVGRSIEPEKEALSRLILILAGGGAVGLVLALVSGFFLAGRTLRPISNAMERQRAFVADASHELRTPLALIRANAELLQRHSGETIEANRPALDDIVRETDGLSTLVSQMLTLARADAGATPFTLTEVALHDLAQDVGRQAQVLADNKGLQLGVRVDGPVLVKGDQVRLRELLLILLDNAIKFTDVGGTVELALKADSGKAVLRVNDSGGGIPPDDLPHIFDRFYRADKARSRAEGGAGLGLAIAKWIVEGHRGSIRVDSQAGKGTTFTVELPTH
ncbi:MAG: sensor histidine kinase [Dehalococcoidia bacterium]